MCVLIMIDMFTDMRLCKHELQYLVSINDEIMCFRTLNIHIPLGNFIVCYKTIEKVYVTTINKYFSYNN